MKTCCENCKFARRDSDTPQSTPKQLVCYRFPPMGFPMAVPNPLTNQPQMGNITIYPIVPADKFCGEFRAKIRVKK